MEAFDTCAKYVGGAVIGAVVGVVVPVCTMHLINKLGNWNYQRKHKTEDPQTQE